MSETTGIEWTDHTFNIAWGCMKVSPGCQHCYADTLSRRYGHDVWGPASTTARRTFGAKHWAEPLKWNAKAEREGLRKRAKALGPPELGMELFAQAARIQKEACEAAGRSIPMIQENVCGAQKWVGRARWHYGSYYLWGDVPALMPVTERGVMKAGVAHRANGETIFHGSAARALGDGVKAGDRNKGRANGSHTWTADFEEAGIKNTGGSWFNVAHNTTSGHGQNPDGRKVGGIRLSEVGFNVQAVRNLKAEMGGKPQSRKAASARIAKIPFALASYIARVYGDAARAA